MICVNMINYCQVTTITKKGKKNIAKKGNF